MNLVIIKNNLNNNFPLSHKYRSLYVREKILETYYSVDNYFSNIISSGKPASIVRLGGTEARVLGLLLQQKKLLREWDFSALMLNKLNYKKRLYQLKNNAGLYPIDESQLGFFWDTYNRSIVNSDLIGVWGNTFTWCENYFLKNTESIPVPHMACSPWIESYNNSNLRPWSYSLKNKKVLVISPFSRSFSEQFERINKVFPNLDYPLKQPIFIQSPITQGGIEDGLSSKFHFEKICQQILNLDFDVALISAGVYATPIANYIKSIGKIGINCGGELQLFFGVLGERWINSNKHKNYFNSYWVRPKLDERPKNWRNIENGCYW